MSRAKPASDVCWDGRIVRGWRTVVANVETLIREGTRGQAHQEVLTIPRVYLENVVWALGELEAAQRAVAAEDGRTEGSLSGETA